MKTNGLVFVPLLVSLVLLLTITDIAKGGHLVPQSAKPVPEWAKIAAIWSKGGNSGTKPGNAVAGKKGENSVPKPVNAAPGKVTGTGKSANKVSELAKIHVVAVRPKGGNSATKPGNPVPGSKGGNSATKPGNAVTGKTGGNSATKPENAVSGNDRTPSGTRPKYNFIMRYKKPGSCKRYKFRCGARTRCCKPYVCVMGRCGKMRW